MIRIAVTGANGFVGQSLIQRLSKERLIEATALQRRPPENPLAEIIYLSAPDLRSPQGWGPLLQDIDVVIHAAARVHIMHDRSTDPLTEFRALNVSGTLDLAREAARSGVRRFVFLSSIKVNGEATSERPFRATDTPAPQDAYGISKLEAETALRELSTEVGMEWVIVRPPLVYGPGVGANFGSLMRWIARGVPLPLGNIQNRRSLVGLDNLVDLLVVCATHPAAANQIFLISDGEDLSTTDLVRKIANALSVPARLLPIPATWLRRCAMLLGKTAVADRICDSLQVDIEPTCNTLGWSPPVSVDEGILRTATCYLTHST